MFDSRRISIHLIATVIIAAILDFILVLPSVSLSKILMPLALIGIGAEFISRNKYQDEISYSIPRWIVVIGGLWLVFYLYLVLRWAALPTSRGFAILQSYIFIPIFAAAIIIIPRSHSEFNRIVNYTLLTITILAVLAAMDVALGARRAYPLGMNPNSLGLRFVVGIFLSGVLIAHTKSRIRTIWYIISIFILLLGLVGTGSRGAYLALTGGLLFYILVNNKNMPFQSMNTKNLVPALVVFSGSLLLAPELIVGFFNRFKSLLTFVANPDEAVGAGSKSLQIRYSLLKTSIEMVEIKPLFGFGLGTFQDYTSTLSRFNQPRGAHSTYLYIGSQTGVVGLLVLGTVFAVILNVIRRGMLMGEKNILNESKRMSLLGSIVIAGLINGIAADVVRWKVFWIGIAFALTHYKIIEINANSPDT